MKRYLMGIGGFLALSAGMAKADERALNVRVIYDADAVIQVCQKGVVGCAHKIVIDGDEYLVDALGKSTREDYEAIIGNHQFHKQKETLPGKAVGFIVREKGHFPNPTVEFNVFKAISLDFVLPRGIRPLGKE